MSERMAAHPPGGGFSPSLCRFLSRGSTIGSYHCTLLKTISLPSCGVIGFWGPHPRRFASYGKNVASTTGCTHTIYQRSVLTRSSPFGEVETISPLTVALSSAPPLQHRRFISSSTQTLMATVPLIFTRCIHTVELCLSCQYVLGIAVGVSLLNVLTGP